MRDEVSEQSGELLSRIDRLLAKPIDLWWLLPAERMGAQAIGLRLTKTAKAISAARETAGVGPLTQVGALLAATAVAATEVLPPLKPSCPKEAPRV
ncbi:UNVERIFIED_ORG: hypothetical protein J2W85_006695 [Ensifer adhaerens]|nr:hypothetical protein [Ensifer adhaerens]